MAKGVCTALVKLCTCKLCSQRRNDSRSKPIMMVHHKGPFFLCKHYGWYRPAWHVPRSRSVRVLSMAEQQNSWVLKRCLCHKTYSTVLQANFRNRYLDNLYCKYILCNSLQFPLNWSAWTKTSTSCFIRKEDFSYFNIKNSYCSCNEINVITIFWLWHGMRCENTTGGHVRY